MVDFISHPPHAILYLKAQVLQSHESFIVQAFAFPAVHVLRHHRVAKHLKQLPQQERNVVPRLRVDHLRQWMSLNVLLNVLTLISVVLVVRGAHVTVPRQT